MDQRIGVRKRMRRQAK